MNNEAVDLYRRSPSTKFDAGCGGTFSGAPGRRSRPAETSHDSTDARSLALCSFISPMSLLDSSEWAFFYGEIGSKMKESENNSGWRAPMKSEGRNSLSPKRL